MNTLLSPALDPAAMAMCANLPTGEITTDHELMLAVRDGELRRLGELFERHHRPLFGFFLRMTSQPALSEDLVQTVFYQILKYRHTYRDEGSFTTWLYQIARNVFAKNYRRNRVDRVEELGENEAEPVDDSPAPGDKAAKADDLDLLRAALRHLSDDQRELLTLTHLKSVAHKEIAEVLDCTTTVVKVRAHRALRELRRIYFKLQAKGGCP